MKDNQRSFLDAIGLRVSKLGFAQKHVGRSFYRKMPEGKALFHLTVIEHPGSFDVVADVAVRFDKLEDLINANSTLLTKKEKEETCTLGAELGNITGSGQMRWTITSASDVDRTADDLIATFIEVGIPYLKEAVTLEGAYRLLTSAGKEAWLHNPIHAARAKRVVGLAKMLGLSTEIAGRVRENRLFLESINDYGLQDFKRFVAAIGAEE